MERLDIGMLRYSAAIAVGIAVGLASGAAKAAYVVNIDQVGANVVATGQGSLDFNLLTFTGFQSPNVDGVSGPDGYVEVGTQDYDGFSGFGDYYTTVTGPAFGTGGFATADSATGVVVGLDLTDNAILVPGGYFANDDLGVSTSTFNNTTIAALGLTPGQYVYTFGSQGTDSFTINVAGTAVSAVPLPTSAPMFGAAVLALGIAGYSLKRKKATAA